MSDDPTPNTGEEAEDLEACAYMSLLSHRSDGPSGPEEIADFEDLVAKIKTRGRPPCVLDDGTEMGPTLEIRLHGMESGKVVQIMMDAHAALELADRLIEDAEDAIGEEDEDAP